MQSFLSNIYCNADKKFCAQAVPNKWVDGCTACSVRTERKRILPSAARSPAHNCLYRPFIPANTLRSTMSTETLCWASQVLMVGQTMYTINAGDSKAVLCRLGKPITLTEDHKPGSASERARIEAAGGEVPRSPPAPRPPPMYL